MRRIAAHGIVLAGLLAACAWLTCLVPPIFLRPDVTGSRIYDWQALSLLAGRWDVPPGSPEWFQTDGRYYIYYGPTPALLRLPFAGLLVAYPHKAGFFSLFLAVSAAIAAALALARRLTGSIPSPVFTLALAGPTLVIASRIAVYHEALAWGGAFALLAAFGYVRYARSPSLLSLVACALCGLLAAWSRMTWLPSMAGLLAALAVGAVLGRGDWFPIPPPRRRVAHALAACLAIGVVVGGALGVQRAKFGSWTSALPLERHVAFINDAQRLARIRGSFFLLSNVRTNLAIYFSPATVDCRGRFPWIQPDNSVRFRPEARIDSIEHVMSLPHAAGALMVLSAIGIVAAGRAKAHRSILPAVAALGLAPLALLPAVSVCGRYLYDFLPALALAAALGLGALARRRALTLGLAVLAAYNALAGFGLALAIQRTYAPAPRRAQVEHLYGDRLGN